MPIDMNVNDHIESTSDEDGNASCFMLNAVKTLRRGLHSTLNVFGTASLSDAGEDAGDVPVLGAGGTLSRGVVPQASQTEFGSAQYASSSQSVSRVANRVVSPNNISSLAPSTTVSGAGRRATSSQVDSGSTSNLFVSPSDVRSALGFRRYSPSALQPIPAHHFSGNDGLQVDLGGDLMDFGSIAIMIYWQSGYFGNASVRDGYSQVTRRTSIIRQATRDNPVRLMSNRYTSAANVSTLGGQDQDSVSAFRALDLGRIQANFRANFVRSTIAQTIQSARALGLSPTQQLDYIEDHIDRVAETNPDFAADLQEFMDELLQQQEQSGGGGGGQNRGFGGGRTRTKRYSSDRGNDRTKPKPRSTVNLIGHVWGWNNADTPNILHLIQGDNRAQSASTTGPLPRPQLLRLDQPTPF